MVKNTTHQKNNCLTVSPEIFAMSLQPFIID